MAGTKHVRSIHWSGPVSLSRKTEHGCIMNKSNRFFHLFQSQFATSIRLAICSWFFCFASLSSYSHAEAPITSSGLNTEVNLSATPPTGTVLYNITGGTRVGTNLFHSFGDFNVPSSDIANFHNETVLPTSNILSRVTGGNPSSIFGTIRTEGFGNANLFLMNPAGIVFGPSATLNVGGSVAFTTANYLRLAEVDGSNAGIFRAETTSASLLTSASVAAFGFLGTNQAAIAVQGSTLKVQPGQSISLAGGNQGFASVPNGVTVTDGKLSAPGGQVNIASVASRGEVMAGTLEYAPNVNVESFGALGTIKVSQESSIDVSGNGGSTVLIRSGQFVLDNDSKISANITGPGPVINGVESIGGGIDIVVSQDAIIRNAATLETNVLGNSTTNVQYGGVTIKADRIEVRGILNFETGNIVPTTIQSNVVPGSTGGNSGDIKLDANSILVKDFGVLNTQTDGAGNSGNIILKSADNLEADNAAMFQTFTGLSLLMPTTMASGNAGNIEMTSTHGNVLLTNTSSVTSQSQIFGNGGVGSITVNAPNGEILLTGSLNGSSTLFTSIDGTGANADRGGIQLTAQNLNIKDSGIQIDNFTPFQPGSLTVNLTGRLSMSGDLSPPTLVTTTRRSARSADLNITAHDILLTSKSLISTETYRNGDGGTLNIFTQNLELTNGSQITSSSRFNPEPPPGPPETPSGTGGTVTIRGLAGPAQSVLIDGQNSGIFTNAEGTGPGGAVDLSAQSITIQNGGTISASTKGLAPSATGGSITVKATDHVIMTSSALITASSTGSGNAGNISINAGQQFEMRDSSVTTQATKASGGNIDIQAVERVRVVNSTISSSVQGDDLTSGGNITIDPNVVVLQNSQITAQADRGAGGNIAITTPLFLADSSSLVSASSQRGVNGTVTIQNPTSNLSETLGTLPSNPSQAHSLLTQRCAALVNNGQASSFVVAGREQLPSDPGGWLTSPLALAALGENVDADHAIASAPAIMTMATRDTDTISLRRLTPTGFLMANFADSEATGCRS